MPPQKLGKQIVPERTWTFGVDMLIFGVLLAVFYGVVIATREWMTPFAPTVKISSEPSALPAYAGYSLFRIAVAYVLSLGFALVYGYIAAYYRKAERVMIPILDILQSIPVLSFLPGVMLAMVALFPHKEFGIELGSIVLIFTGQVWNIAFSFYSSLKSIPNELREVARIYRFSWWQRFTQLELPFSAIGLVWNSMMSVAGAWFFLMACEMFVLGTRDFRLPGLGSYLQTASNAGDFRSIAWGVGVLVGVVLLLDQLIWRPVIAWADKFKFEQVESASPPKSPILDLLRRSRTIEFLNKKAFEPCNERISALFVSANHDLPDISTPRKAARWKIWVSWLLAIMVGALFCFAAVRALMMIAHLTEHDVAELARGAGATFLRVAVSLLIGAAWTIPVGVAIGFNPRLARVMQPLTQIAASIPATALFPVVVLLLIKWGGGLNTAAIVLMLLGTQWYILFNVIAGAMAIPSDLKEVAHIFRFSLVDRWRRLILPGIFPYLVTGFVTAAGGAWNASIVAEYFHYKNQILSTTGLGATISKATDAGNFTLLLAATIVMSAVVVTINRLFWRKLYNLAQSRYKLET